MDATLYEFKTVVLNSSGNGTVKLGPQSAREVWHAGCTTYVSVSIPTGQTAPTKQAKCFLSIGDNNTKQFRDNTTNGSSGDHSSKIDRDIKSGEYIWADWTGGDPGMIATLTITGSKSI